MIYLQCCPCGSQLDYQNCCGKYIVGNESASTPEALMRSRYVAYTQANIDYIQRSMQGSAAQGFNAQEAKLWAQQVKWLRLRVIRSSPIENNKGYVEFEAYYILDNKLCVIHEVSEFLSCNSSWYYIDGKQIATKLIKINVNDPCPCGSKKKYKKCCVVVKNN